MSADKSQDAGETIKANPDIEKPATTRQPSLDNCLNWTIGNAIGDQLSGQPGEQNSGQCMTRIRPQRLVKEASRVRTLRSPACARSLFSTTAPSRHDAARAQHRGAAFEQR